MSGTQRQVVSFSPVFALRGVSLQEVMESYHQGQWQHYQPTGTQAVTASAPKRGVIKGFHPEKASYAINDLNGAPIVVATTNHAHYRAQPDAAPSRQQCDWCRRKFQHDPMRVPLWCEKYLDDAGDVQQRLWGEDALCSYECALAHTQLYAAAGYPMYAEAIGHITAMFQRQHPGAKLLPAPDWRLLKRNRGSLDDQEYDDRNHRYIRSTHLVLLPAKAEYIRE